MDKNTFTEEQINKIRENVEWKYHFLHESSFPGHDNYNVYLRLNGIIECLEMIERADIIDDIRQKWESQYEASIPCKNYFMSIKKETN